MISKEDLKWLLEMSIVKMLDDENEYNDPPAKESLCRLVEIVRSNGFERKEIKYLDNLIGKRRLD